MNTSLEITAPKFTVFVKVGHDQVEKLSQRDLKRKTMSELVDVLTAKIHNKHWDDIEIEKFDNFSELRLTVHVFSESELQFFLEDLQRKLLNQVQNNLNDVLGVGTINLISKNVEVY